MKLLLVTHYYPAHRGGIEIVAGEVARRLAPAHEITWAASDCDPVPAIDGRFRALPMRAANFIERLAGVPFPLWGPFSCARLWREVRAADLVHIHDFAYAGNWLAFIGARVFGKPIVITQHIGLVPFASAFLRTVQRVAHATVGRWMLARADQVVFVSPVVRDYYAAIRLLPHASSRDANGVDTDTFAGGHAGDRARARGIARPRPLEAGTALRRPVSSRRKVSTCWRRWRGDLSECRVDLCRMGTARSAHLESRRMFASYENRAARTWCRCITPPISWCCRASAKACPSSSRSH